MESETHKIEQTWVMLKQIEVLLIVHQEQY